MITCTGVLSPSNMRDQVVGELIRCFDRLTCQMSTVRLSQSAVCIYIGYAEQQHSDIKGFPNQMDFHDLHDNLNHFSVPCWMTWENSPNSRPEFGDSPNSADKGPSLEKSPNSGVEFGDFSKLSDLGEFSKLKARVRRNLQTQGLSLEISPSSGDFGEFSKLKARVWRFLQTQVSPNSGSGVEFGDFSKLN